MRKAKVLAFVLAGTMLFSMTAMAAPSPSAGTVSGKSTSGGSGSSTSMTAAEAVIAQIASAASEEGKSVGEYTNNAVVELPGVPDVVPMGQGGHVIINGAPSNVVFFLAKPTAAQLNLAKSQAASLGGKLLNVFTTKSAIVGKFQTAQVNFYAKGVKAGQAIRVYQLVDGQWAELTVSEIREDHIVVNLTSHGTLAFIEVPAM